MSRPSRLSKTHREEFLSKRALGAYYGNTKDGEVASDDSEDLPSIVRIPTQELQQSSRSAHARPPLSTVASGLITTSSGASFSVPSLAVVSPTQGTHAASGRSALLRRRKHDKRLGHKKRSLANISDTLDLGELDCFSSNVDEFSMVSKEALSFDEPPQPQPQPQAISVPTTPVKKLSLSSSLPSVSSAITSPNTNAASSTATPLSLSGPVVLLTDAISPDPGSTSNARKKRKSAKIHSPHHLKATDEGEGDSNQGSSSHRESRERDKKEERDGKEKRERSKRRSRELSPGVLQAEHASGQGTSEHVSRRRSTEIAREKSTNHDHGEKEKDTTTTTQQRHALTSSSTPIEAKGGSRTRNKRALTAVPIEEHDERHAVVAVNPNAQPAVSLTASSPSLISGALPAVSLDISMPRAMLLRAMMSTSDPTNAQGSETNVMAKSRSGGRRKSEHSERREVRDSRDTKDGKEVREKEKEREKEEAKPTDHVGEMKPSTSNPKIEPNSNNSSHQPSPIDTAIVQSNSTLSSPTSSGAGTTATVTSTADPAHSLILKQLPKTITANENFRTSLAVDPLSQSPSPNNTSAISKPNPPTLELVQALARAQSSSIAHETTLTSPTLASSLVSPFTSPRDAGGEITRKLSSNMIQYRITKRASSLPRLVSGSSIDLLANGALELAAVQVETQGARAMNDELPRADSPYSRQRLNMSGSQKKEKAAQEKAERQEKHKEREKEKREGSGGRKPRRRRSASVTTAAQGGAGTSSSGLAGGSGGHVAGGGAGSAHVTQSSDALVPMLAPLIDRLGPGGKPQSADRLLHSLHKSRQAQMLLLRDPTPERIAGGPTGAVTVSGERVESPNRIRRSSSTKSFSSTTRAFSCDGDEEEFEDEAERIFFSLQNARQRMQHLDLAASKRSAGGSGIHGSHPSTTDSSSKAVFIAGSGGLSLASSGESKDRKLFRSGVSPPLSGFSTSSERAPNDAFSTHSHHLSRQASLRGASMALDRSMKISMQSLADRINTTTACSTVSTNTANNANNNNSNLGISSSPLGLSNSLLPSASYTGLANSRRLDGGLYSNGEDVDTSSAPNSDAGDPNCYPVEEYSADGSSSSSDGDASDDEEEFSLDSGEEDQLFEEGETGSIHHSRHANGLFDWNEQFYKLQESPENYEKWSRLASLATDFVYAAESYGKIIISERYLEDHQKTLLPQKIGGIAGGEKFLCQNIIFKFAVDSCLYRNNEGSFWMYGGTKKSDRLAAKSAAHELKGLTGFYNSGVKGLRYPLMTILDYTGFRLVALSYLPIDKTTIRYGSNDGGRNVRTENALLNEKMEEVGRALNTKGHQSGLNEAFIYMPGDVEGHLGKDNHFYVLDFARVFPPEFPSFKPGEKVNREMFYRLLRPEFVRYYASPLNSDSFSGFSKNITDREEIIEATRFIYTQKIPKFANWLDEEIADVNIEQFMEQLGELLHRSGLNMRHLGRIRHATKNDLMKKFLITEIVARVLKNQLNSLLRKAMKKIFIPSKDPYLMLIAKYLNKVLYHEKEVPLLDSLQRDAQIQFPRCLSDYEQRPGHNLICACDNLSVLLRRLCDLTGVRLSKNAMEELRMKERVTLIKEDIVEVKIRVKRLSIIDEAIAKSFMFQAHQSSGPQRLRLFEMAVNAFHDAGKSCTNSIENLFQWANCLVHLAQYSPPKESLIRLKQAEAKLRFCNDLNKNEENILYCWGIVCLKIYSQAKIHKREKWFTLARKKFIRAIAKNPSLAVERLLKEANDEFAKVLEKYQQQDWFQSLDTLLQTFNLNSSTYQHKYADLRTIESDILFALSLNDCAVLFMSQSQLYYQIAHLYLIWASHLEKEGQEIKFRKACQLLEMAMMKNRIVRCDMFYYVVKPQRPFLQNGAISPLVMNKSDTLAPNDGKKHKRTLSTGSDGADLVSKRERRKSLLHSTTNRTKTSDGKARESSPTSPEPIGHTSDPLVDVYLHETNEKILSNVTLSGYSQGDLLYFDVIESSKDDPLDRPHSFDYSTSTSDLLVLRNQAGPSFITEISFFVPKLRNEKVYSGKLFVCFAENEWGLEHLDLSFLDTLSESDFVEHTSGLMMNQRTEYSSKVLIGIDYKNLVGSQRFYIRILRSVQFIVLKFVPTPSVQPHFSFQNFQIKGLLHFMPNDDEKIETVDLIVTNSVNKIPIFQGSGQNGLLQTLQTSMTRTSFANLLKISMKAYAVLMEDSKILVNLKSPSLLKSSEHIPFSFTLTNCKFLHDELLLNLVELCPRLKYLNIRNSSKITDAFFERTPALLELTGLELQECSAITVASLQFLNKKFPKLELLGMFSEVSFDTKKCFSFLDNLHISNLDFSHVKRAVPVQPLLAMPSLTRIVFNNSKIQFPELRHEKASKVPKTLACFEAIEISNCDWGGRDLSFNEFFVNNVMKAEKVNITTLNLVYCENSLDQVMEQIALRCGETLRHLCFDNSKFTQRGIMAIAKSSRSIISFSSRVKIGVDQKAVSDDCITQLIENNALLQVLNIYGCDITVRGLRMILGKRGSVLTMLDVSCNPRQLKFEPLDYEDEKNFPVCVTTLRELMLDGMEYFPNQLLIRIMRLNENISMLSLAMLLHIDMQAIVTITQLKNLTALNLSACPFASQDTAITALSQLTKLKVLSLDKLNSLGAILSLADCCKDLQVLDLRTTNMSAYDVSNMRSKLPHTWFQKSLNEGKLPASTFLSDARSHTSKSESQTSMFPRFGRGKYGGD